MPDTIKFSFLTLFLLLLFQGCSNPFQNEQDGSNDPIWIQVASAEHQCITPDYSSLEDALNQLKANHVLVLNSQELNLATCRACSCPTGIVYQAEINGKSLHIALNLGWQQVDEDDDTPIINSLIILLNGTIPPTFSIFCTKEIVIMNKEEIIQLIQELGVKNVKFAVTDIDGVLRGKLISTEKFLKALNDQIGFCNVIFGWDMNDAVYDNTKVSGSHTGYPDSFATIDPNSYRKIPWENDKPFFLADFSQSEEMKDICPRSLLKRIIKEAQELGFTAKFSSEFEWFNFDETMHSLKEKDYANPTPFTTGMFGYSILRASQNSDYFNELFDLLHAFGIPLEGLHTETGDGVYEAAITYDDILESADRAALFKTSVKEIASQYDLIASFMAKWNPDLPGCSQHIHQSLVNKSGENLFFDDSKDGKMSELFEHYLAGQLHCMPHILPMFAPTVNSYKRYVEGSWAPTSVSWGIENRTVAIRVINHKKESMRLENRVPGADTNPYLAMGASLASGLYGIKHKLKLKIPATKGNEYENKTSESLPENLHKATSAMKESTTAKELFGDTFVDHFVKTREWEWRQYKPNQKNWEMKRYFEII